MIDEDPKLFHEEVRRRQRSRAIITALLLGSFALLTFLIAMAKITAGQAQ
jgi:uncharacterized membrane protein (DUF485 family)